MVVTDHGSRNFRTHPNECALTRRCLFDCLVVQVVVVDLDSGSVVDVEAPEPAGPVNKAANDYHRNLMGR